MWKGAFYETIEVLRSYESYDMGVGVDSVNDRNKTQLTVSAQMRGALFRLLDDVKLGFSLIADVDL